MAFALKYRQHRDNQVYMDKIFTCLRWLEIKFEVEYGRIILGYTVDGIKSDASQLWEEKASQYLQDRLREEAMTIAQAFRNEGMQQGRQEISAQIAKNLLASGFEPAIVAKNTGLDLTVMKKLKQDMANLDD